MQLPRGDRFRIERRLGAGSFGEVYAAHDRERGSRVAIKLLRRLGVEALYRFKREFRALAGVAHPNLVCLHELTCDGELWYYTMELVEGADFLTFVRGVGSVGSGSTFDALGATEPPDADVESQRAPDEPAPPPAPLALSEAGEQRLRVALRQLVGAVCALHGAGRLHRDIKPSNVLVALADARPPRVVLLDFGLVQELGPQSSTEDAIVGSPAYMAPEQARGGAQVPATDWYSVGVMLYEALTGRLPHLGSRLDVLWQKQQADPPPPRELVPGTPEDLDALCC
jgi:serine/threonine protein kinase